MSSSAHVRRLVLAWLFAIVLAATCVGLAACSSSGDSDQSSTDSTEATESADESTASADEQSSASADGETRTVTVDGTDYEIPAEVDKVAPTIGALNQITMMLTEGAGEPSKVVATSTAQVSDQFKAILPSYEEGNPEGYDSSDVEQMIEAGVQVVYGVQSMYSDEQISQMEEAGIVFIPLNKLASVDDICATTETIGQILGDDEYAVAKDFTAYWKDNIADCESRTADLSDDEKPTVLNLAYSNGSFTTESGESMISSYIEAAGGVSLSKDYTVDSNAQGQNQGDKAQGQSGQGGQGNGQGGQGGGNRGNMGSIVDEEQIVTWNPDYIITYSTEATDAIMDDAALADVTAVKDGHVYTSPKGLYLWAVRSGEGALMAPWIGTMIHPDLFSDVDMTQMTKDFFSNYYGYDLSDDEAAEVLAGTF